MIWPGTYVSESTLAVVVTGLRQALGDDARQPRFIRTVHRFGYAFCGEARESKNGGPQPREALVAGGLDDLESVPAEAKPLDGTGIGRTAVTLVGRWRWAIAAAGVIVLVSAAWLATRRPRLPDEPQTVVPLTSLPGVELHPALSPDGSRVAFIWHGPDRDNFDVYVKEIASGDMVRVTKDPAPDCHPAWSPDGRHLAFLRLQTTGAAVFLVPAGGGQEQRLAEVAEPLNAFSRQDMWSYWLDWSPDGRFLAVARPRGRRIELGHRPRLRRDGREADADREHGCDHRRLLSDVLTGRATPGLPPRAPLRVLKVGPGDPTPVGRHAAAGSWRAPSS